MTDLGPFLAKLQEQRAAFDGIPRESAAQIVEEAIGKLLLLPGVESASISALDTVSFLILSSIAPNAPFVPLEEKGLELLFHGLMAWLENKERAAVAKGDAVS